MGPSVADGLHKPFGRRLNEGTELMLPATFEVRPLGHHQDATAESYNSGHITSGKPR